MQFTAWQEYLIKVACAVFKIAPEEIGFNIDKGGSLGGDSESDVKIRYSRDKGLKPLLKSIEFWINKWIVQPLDNDFEFKFVGLDVDSEEKELELLNKKVQHGMGWKEYRRAINLPEEMDEGDFPLNQIYLQHMQNQQFADEGMENTDMVDQEEFDEEEMWNGLEKGYEVNPMMHDAMQLLIKGK